MPPSAVPALKPDTTSKQQIAVSTPASQTPTGPSTLASATVASSTLPVEATYALEIARLKTIVNKRRGQLDPLTVAIVDRNLKLVDDAIAQVKQALQKDPASRFLIESLNNAFENKVEVLRTAALLPSRT